MPRSSRSRFDRVNRPSPLQEVQYARPLSTLSSLHHTPENTGGDGRRLSVLPEQMAPEDSQFWQRFDVAAASVGMDAESMRKLEERDRVMDEDLERSMERSTSRLPSGESDRERTPSTQESDRKTRNEYLEKQRKKRRRAHMKGLGLVISICAIIVIVAVLGWYFGRPSETRSTNDEGNPKSD